MLNSRPAARRQQLLDAALTLFEDGDYERMSVREVVRRHCLGHSVPLLPIQRIIISSKHRMSPMPMRCRRDWMQGRAQSHLDLLDDPPRPQALLTVHVLDAVLDRADNLLPGEGHSLSQRPGSSSPAR
jgi:hypothetical protein